MDCDMGSDFTVSEGDFIRIVSACSSSLSLVGCTFVIVTYLAFEAGRSASHRFIVMLSISNWFSAFTYLVGAITISSDYDTLCGGFWCTFVGASAVFFDLAGVMWILCIGFNSYYVLRRAFGTSMTTALNRPSGIRTGSRFALSPQPEHVYHTLSWGLSAIALIIACSAGTFGSVGEWCWVEQRSIQIIVFYVPAGCVLIANVALYSGIHRMVRDHPLENKVTARLRLYVLCYMAVNGVDLLNRCVAWALWPVFGLYLLAAFVLPLQGLMYALVFGLNQNTRKLYREWWNGFRGEGAGGGGAEDFTVPMQ